MRGPVRPVQAKAAQMHRVFQIAHARAASRTPNRAIIRRALIVSLAILLPPDVRWRND
jgi:hypothetical protein